MKRLIPTILAATLMAAPVAAQTNDAAPAAEPAPEETKAPAPALDAAPSSPAEKPEAAPESDAKTEKGDDAGEDLGALGQEVFDLAKGGKWLAALGALMMLLVVLFRRFLFGKSEWFQTKAGGYTAAGIVALLTIVGLSLKVGFSIDVIMAGLTAAGFASGLHGATSDVKKSRSG